MEDLEQKVPDIQHIVEELMDVLGDDFFTFSKEWEDDTQAVGLMHDAMTVHIVCDRNGEVDSMFLLRILSPIRDAKPFVDTSLDSPDAVVEAVLDFFS